jgi:hypothetical protein
VLTHVLTHPEFAGCYQLEIVDDETALLISERGSHLLTGTAFVAVSELLDGRRTVDEIVEAASARVPAAEVFYALDRLEALHVIREAQDEPSPAAAFWDALGIDPAAAETAIRGTTLSLRTFGGIAKEGTAAALSDLGFRLADDGFLSVVLVDDYLRPELAELNEQRLAEERPWLLARPAGSILWIGPLLRPGTSACWECMAQRMHQPRLRELRASTQAHHSSASHRELRAALQPARRRRTDRHRGRQMGGWRDRQ